MKYAKKAYTHFVYCVEAQKIVSGWEYKNDAKDNLAEQKDNYGKRLKFMVVNRKQASLLVDLKDNANWQDHDFVVNGLPVKALYQG